MFAKLLKFSKRKFSGFETVVSHHLLDFDTKQYHLLDFGSEKQQNKREGGGKPPSRKTMLTLFTLLLSYSIFAQSPITKTFTQTLSVQEVPDIALKGPQSIRFNAHGTMHSKGTKDGYQMTAGSSSNPPTLIVKNLQIHTWEQDEIKQEVTIKIQPESGDEARTQELMKHLKIELTENPTGQILVDDNMNIEKMEFTNGWFRRDQNSVILEDGSTYNFETMEIESLLYIPKKSNLTITSRYVGISIGDLEGQLVLDIHGTTIQAGNIDHLKANLVFSKVYGKNFNYAEIDAQASEFSASQVEELNIGYFSLPKNANDLKSLPFQEYNSMGKASSLSKYYLGQVQQLNITTTTSDKFNIESVKDLVSMQSSFSNYHIQTLENSLKIRAKNGDLTIGEVRDGFQDIAVFNEISTIQFGMQKAENYVVHFHQTQFTDIKLPQTITQLSTDNKWKQSYLKGKEEKAGQIEFRCENCKIRLKE